MSDNSKLSGAVQEDLLTLLAFDDHASSIISGSVDPDIFDSSLYQDIAKRSIDFRAQYGTAPKDHLPDILGDILEGKDARKARLYDQTLNNIYQIQDRVNKDFVLSQLNKFVRQQNLKTSVTDAVKALRDGQVDEAEKIIDEGRQRRVLSFDPGIQLHETDRSLAFLNQEDLNIHTGIEKLDYLGICPAPKELYTIIAAAGRGKTWMMIQIGKAAIMQRKVVVHVTLEMSQERMSGRYMQALFSVAKNKLPVQVCRFKLGEVGELSSLEPEVLENRPALTDKGIDSFLRKKLQNAHRLPLMIKEFPTGALSLSGLESYLNSLEYVHGIRPDMVIVDYADLMQIDAANIRVDTGAVYKGLRRIAVERNLAMVTASQSNRQGEDARLITMKHLAEDYSKAAISDNLISYNQTPAEKIMSLGRLFVAKARNEASGQSILLSQAYGLGQFCLNSAFMNGRYWKEIDALSDEDDDDEEGKYD